MTSIDFASLGLSEQLLKALAARNYVTPTPIQARSIPHLLQGKDLLGIAQTGTGKTAAFALPMLQRLHAANRRPRPKCPRALVLAPTRELATQIADSCEAYGKHLHLRGAIVFGGVGQNPQVASLQRGVDVLVATPGRLLDLMQQGHCNLGDVEVLVLDEADRMLDMGFLPDVKRILATLPTARQSLLFSATMPSDITALAQRYLRDPVRIEVTPPAATADRIEQSVWFVKKDAKRDLLIDLLQNPEFVRTLVFTRTKHGADRVAKSLVKAGIDAHAIHGNKSQNARERALDSFRDGKSHVLVATDIAARGIDVPDITHVVNFDLPNIPESYVHRIGRTARAGRDGIAISFCDGEEREYLRDIEKLIKKRIPVAGNPLRDDARAAAAQRADERNGRPATPPPAPAPAKAPSSSPWDNAPFGAAIDGTDDAREREAVAVGNDDDGSQPGRQRQRPTPRQHPGPYAPDPQRKPRPHDNRPRHERNRDQHKGGGRPAMPTAVDPEMRRRNPEWLDEQREAEQREAQRELQREPQRGPRPHGHGNHHGQAPQRQPSHGHRGPRPQQPSHGPRHGGGHGSHGGQGGSSGPGRHPQRRGRR